MGRLDWGSRTPSVIGVIFVATLTIAVTGAPIAVRGPQTSTSLPHSLFGSIQTAATATGAPLAEAPHNSVLAHCHEPSVSATCSKPWSAPPLNSASASNWSSVVLPNSPTPRWDAAMSFDSTDGYFLLFGGEACTVSAGCTSFNDTWRYNGTGWSELFPSSEPPARVAAMMTYDAADGAILMFGGVDDSVTGIGLNDTWEYAAGSWTETNNGNHSSPPPTYSGSLSYDPESGDAILFGGCCGTSSNFDDADTWEYANGTWTKIASANSPAPREGAGLFYDPADDGLILVGGIYCDWVGCNNYGDTWLLSNRSWVELNPLRAPNASAYSPAFYDPVLRAGVLVDSSGTTWLFVADDWGPTNTSSVGSQLTNAAYGVDPVNGTIVAIGEGPGWVFAAGAAGSNRTFTLNGTPQVPFGAAFAVSSRGLDVGETFQVTVSAWGGSWSYRYSYVESAGNCDSLDAPLLSCVFWEAGTISITAIVFDSGANTTSMNWSIEVRSAPSVHVAVSPLVVDQGQGVSLAANLTGGSPPQRFVWVGLPPGSCQSVSGPMGACFPPVGLWTIQGRYCDNQGVCTTSTPVTLLVNPDPTVQLESWPSLDSGTFRAVFFAIVSGGTAPYHFHWTFGDGAQEDTMSPVTSHSYAAPGPWTVQALVGDSVSVSNSSEGTVQFNATSLPPAPPSVTLAESAALIDLGANVTISGQVSRGSPPYSLYWGGLPPGCSSNGSSTIVCTPSTPGQFTVELDAVDRLGAEGSAAVNLSVEPALVALLSVESSTSCSLSSAIVTLNASVFGGDPPYQYSWSFGDGASSTSMGPILHSFPYSSQSYTARLTVRDALDGAASTTALIPAVAPSGCASTVVQPTSPPPGVGLQELGVALAGVGALALLVGWAVRAQYGRRAFRERPPLK